MPIEMRIRRDLSFLELVRLHKSGMSVTKSPHVGNFYPNNLAVASLGIPLKVVDANFGDKDFNFHPNAVIVGGRKQIVAPSNRMSSHALVTKEPDVFADRFVIGARLSHVHMRALRDAVRNTNARTWSESLVEFGDDAVALMQISAEMFPELWFRVVNDDGTTELCACTDGWSQIERLGVYGIDGNTHGWVTPNIVNILIDIMVEAKRYNSSVIYHLSGPDMYRYMNKKSFLSKFQELFEQSRMRLDWNISETLEFHLACVAEMRFAVPYQYKRSLDTLIETWMKMGAFRAKLAERFKNARALNHNIQSILAEISPQRVAIEQELKDAVDGCHQVFYDIREGTYVSQYDLLSSGDDIYVHPWALEASFNEIELAYSAMKQFAHS